MISTRYRLKATRYHSGQVTRPGWRLALRLPEFGYAATFGILLLLAMPVPAQAQPCPVPPCGGGGGGGLKPIAISLTQDMAFGTLAPDGSIPGVAVIDPATGSKTVAGGVVDFGGIHMPAVFRVTGTKNMVFTITLPGAVTLSSGGNSMTLDSFTSDPAIGLLPNNGRTDVSVGATLHVGANQAAGTYTGVFTVTVNY